MELDTTVRLAIMDGFLAGTVPTVTSVASAVETNDENVAAAFDRLAASRAIVLSPGTRDILMAAPFAGVPTPFQVRVADRSYYANCIWDSLGISAALAGQGRSPAAAIATRCPDCGDSLRVEVRDARVILYPPDAVVHFAVPASRWWADIVFT